MSEERNQILDGLIRDAGIKPGCRVLDLGCGRGDVSLILAEAVGPDGVVVGLDRSEQVLAMAGERAREAGFTHLSFGVADLSQPLPELAPFDAIVARRVLMYLPDPVVLMRGLTALLKAGGVLAFQECDATMSSGCIEDLPLHKRVNDWIWKTVAAEGGNTHMGFSLPAVLQAGGFAVRSMRADAVIQGQPPHFGLAAVTKAILPRIIERGVATAAEIDIDTLAQRMRDERSDHTVFINELLFSVIAVRA